MNRDHSEIVFTLDRSDSMQSMVESAINGFNRVLREQREVPGSEADPKVRPRRG
jgi:hypothetical protein